MRHKSAKISAGKRLGTCDTCLIHSLMILTLGWVDVTAVVVDRILGRSYTTTNRALCKVRVLQSCVNRQLSLMITKMNKYCHIAQNSSTQLLRAM